MGCHCLLRIIILSKVKSEKDKSYDITYMWNLRKKIQMNLFTDVDSQTENKFRITKGEREAGGEA